MYNSTYMNQQNYFMMEENQRSGFFWKWGCGWGLTGKGFKETFWGWGFGSVVRAGLPSGHWALAP
jgi:hypothetical protein